jgi:predicted GNAT family acetyltransferase
MSDVKTVHNSQAHRYEGWCDDELAGFAEYQLTDQLVVFTHTEVDDRFEGRGVGSAIARFALEDVRDQGTRKVLPLCPFIKGWIEKHPDFVPLVYGAPRSTARD